MRRPLTILFLLVCAVGFCRSWRAACRIEAQAQTQLRERPGIDYFEFAKSLKQSGILGWGGQPSAFRGIVFPAFLSMTESFAVDSRPRTPRCQALTGVLETVVVGWMALELHSPQAAVCTAALMALRPSLADGYFSEPYRLESFFSLLLLLVAASLLAWCKGPSLPRACLLGFALGVSLLCRSTLFLFPLCLAVPAWTKRLSGGKTQAMALLVVSYLSLAPWVGRNAYQFHSFIPFEDHAATRNLLAGAWGFVDNASGPYQDVLANEIEPNWSLSSDMGRMRALALRRIAAAPGPYFRSCLRRLWFLLRVYPLWLGLAALGAVLGWEIAGMRGQAGLIAYFVLIHCPMTVEARYLKPILPVLLLLAGCAVTELCRRVWPRGPQAAVVATRPRLTTRAALGGVLVLLGSLYSISVAMLAQEVLLSWRPCILGGRMASFRCGQQLSGERRYGAARQRLDRALLLTDREPDELFELRARILAESAHLDLLAGRPAQARARLDQAARADAEPLRAMALRLQNGGSPSESLSFYDAIIARRPGEARYYVDRAVASALAGQQIQAVSDLQTAARMRPQDVQTHLNLGMLLERQGFLRQALAQEALAVEFARASYQPFGLPSPYLPIATAARDTLARKLALSRRRQVQRRVAASPAAEARE